MENKIALGIIMEKWLYAVLKSIFKTSEGFKVKHVDWSNYSYGHNTDLRVFQRNRQILNVECKNWRTLNRPYGTGICKSEILHRFQNHAGGIKLLVITTLTLLTKQAISMLRQSNIHAIETNKLIGKRDFPRKHHLAKLFYQIKQQIAQLLSCAKKVLFGCGLCQSKLVTDVNDIGYTDAYDILRNLSHKHDTDSKKQLVETHQNSLVERILNVAKQAGNKENQYEAHGFWLIPIEKE